MVLGKKAPFYRPAPFNMAMDVRTRVLGKHLHLEIQGIRYGSIDMHISAISVLLLFPLVYSLLVNMVLLRDDYLYLSGKFPHRPS